MQSTVHMWANGFRIWHARVSADPNDQESLRRARRRAGRALRAEMEAHGDIKPGSGFRLKLEVYETDETAGTVVFREVVA